MPELTPWTLLSPDVPLHVLSGLALLVSPAQPRHGEVRAVQVTAGGPYRTASIRYAILGADDAPRTAEAPAVRRLNEFCADKFGQRLDHVLVVPGISWSRRIGLFAPRTATAVRGDESEQLFDAHHLVSRIAALPLPEGAPPPAGADPSATAAQARIDAVKAAYGELAADIAYRIECSALFDTSAPLTRQYELLMLRWEDDRARLSPDDLERLAREVSLAFDTARGHAEAVGLTHLPTTAHADAGRAIKAAHLAKNAATDGERTAAMAQVVRLLDSIALYYLPPADEAPLMLGGAHPQLGHRS